MERVDCVGLQDADCPARILFLLPGREEFVQMAISLSQSLRKFGILLVPFITHAYEIGFSDDTESSFRKAGIGYLTLDKCYRRTVRDVLREVRPDAVVTTNDLFAIERSFALACRDLGVSFVVIRESTRPRFQSPNLEWSPLGLLRKLGQTPRLSKELSFFVRSMVQSEPRALTRPLYLIQTFLQDFRGEIAGQFADYILAATAEDAALLRESCPRAKRVQVVGNPRFDEVAELMSADEAKIRDQVRRTLNMPQGKKILLFLSSSHVEHGALEIEKKALIYSEILGVLHSLDNNYHIVIKLHPMEREFVLSNRPDLCGNVTVTKSDLSKLIVSSDLVLTWPSTAMINVVLAHKPMIILGVLGDLNGALLSVRRIVEYGCCLVATNMPELRNAVLAASEDGITNRLMVERQRRFVTEMQLMDGKSLNRIVEFIESILPTRRLERL